jgi:hypothetical protein
MDSQIALKNPKIEEKLNLSKITGNLDKTAQEIFIQNDFIPVLKSLELILDRKNLNDLEGFIHNIPINNVLKVYVSYMTNESLKNEDYQQSLKIIQKYLIEQKIIDIDGLLKFND